MKQLIISRRLVYGCSVGIKVVLKDNSVLPIYVSKEKVLFNSNKYLNDVKEANAILKELEKRLQS